LARRAREAELVEKHERALRFFRELARRAR